MVREEDLSRVICSPAFWKCKPYGSRAHFALTTEGAFVQNRAQACHACGETKWRRAGAVGEAGKADLLLISTTYLPEVIFTGQKRPKLLALSLCYGRGGKQGLTTPRFCLFWALLAMSHVAALSPWSSQTSFTLSMTTVSLSQIFTQILSHPRPRPATTTNQRPAFTTDTRQAQL